MRAGCFQSDDFKANKLWRCFHSGDLGDIIYSLLFCRSLGDVHLLLGPSPGLELRQQMNPKVFEWIAPLLRAQSWIKALHYVGGVPACDYNLNDFRKTWFKPGTGCSMRRRLFETYSEHFRKPLLPESEAWLSTPDPIIDEDRPVIVARSPRFHGPMPWQALSNRYAGKMRFIGLETEYKDWSNSYGNTSEYQSVRDALEMARVIAGAQLFIGNQSFPMSLAISLNVPIIQEVCPSTPDCVFERANAIYSNRGPFECPSLKTPHMRPVTTQTNREGLIELGPCDQAFGIGDTLSITPLAAALGKRAVMVMPPRMASLSFLFHALCQVRITDNYPVFTWAGMMHTAARKLSMFGFHAHSPIPAIHSTPEAIHRAKPLLDGISNPVAFCPTCSRHWEHVRQRPFTFWKPIIAELAKRYTVCQFGRADYPTVEGARRMPFVDLETLAALYHLIGNYVGVHTGDHHLMLAAGGRCVVAEPEPIPEFHTELWSYNSPRIIYAKLSHPQTVLDAIKKLPL